MARRRRSTGSMRRPKGSAPSNDAPANPKLPPLPPMKRKKMRFGCPFCKSSLRIPGVARRTRIRCPRCAADFYIYPDGRVDAPETATPAPAPSPARKTISLSAIPTINAPIPESSPRPAAPPEPLDARPQRRSKSRPNRRQTLFESGEFDGAATGLKFETVTNINSAALDDLRRAAGIDDEDSGERDEGGYILLPEDSVEVKRKRRGRKRHAKKRRRKTEEQIKRRAPVFPPGEAESDTEAGAQALATSREVERRRKSTKAGEPSRRRKTTARRRDLRSDSRERSRSGSRERSREGSLSGSLELPPPGPPTVAITLFALFALAPLLVSAVMLLSTSRDRGFATKGALGEALDDLGHGVERGIRSLNDLTINAESLKR